MYQDKKQATSKQGRNKLSSGLSRLGVQFGVVMCLSLYMLPVLAATEKVSALASPVGPAEVIKMVLGLLVVIAVLFLSLYGMKRFQQVKLAKGSHMKVLSGMNLSVRDRIVLLEVNEQQILVGVSPGRIQTLHVFSSADDKIKNDTPSFQASMQQALKTETRS